MKKLILILLTTILLGGCSKEIKIIDSNCECYLKFNENWEESVFGEEYEGEDGELIQIDHKIIGEEQRCLTMWNQEKIMSLRLSNFIDDDTMMLDDSEILKVIRNNLEIENRYLGYVLKEESEYRFFNKKFHVFVAELSVGGNYQVNLVEIKEDRCIMIEVMGETVEGIFEELETLELENQKW